MDPDFEDKVKCCVGVYNLQEAEGDERKEREKVIEILESISYLKMDGIRTYRVGKFSESKNRVVKVTLPSTKHMIRVLNGQRRYGGVRIYPWEENKVKVIDIFFGNFLELILDVWYIVYHSSNFINNNIGIKFENNCDM